MARLGCIADDFTGATDLANNLVRAGMRVVQLIGVPTDAERSSLGAGLTDCDAIVVALKSRTIEPAAAVEQSLAACDWLLGCGVEQIYFKYCSTFDSTPKGNIGPVIDALCKHLNAPFTIATPAFPDNHRSVFMGHLFVGEQLLSDSGMKNHPLTPMTDSNLVRVLQSQSSSRVGLISSAVVRKGSAEIANAMMRLQADGIQSAIVDAITNEDLLHIGKASKGLRLVTAGSGLAIGLPQNWNIAPNDRSAALPTAAGRSAIISGSCSLATNAQVADFIARGGRALAVDAMRVAAGQPVVQQALSWAHGQPSDAPILIYSTAESGAIRAVQSELGVEAAGQMIEKTLADIARELVGAGVGRLVVAGGETSGACVASLGIKLMQIGPQIDPGVPWCYAQSEHGGVHIALKSGNFGTTDFFTKAFAMLD
ncbi:MAG: four-carbon acid sugar kinase family protein [Betaproteobacteria bacterium]|nr:MAG: four-carbon acid sugar kinase family protein [Betaproteobacteria bacterium]